MTRGNDQIAYGVKMNALIHKAVQRDLDGFDIALGAFPPAGDHERATALAARFGWLDTMLGQHHEGEERHLWPVVRTSEQTTREVAVLSEEHERMVGALARHHSHGGRPTG